MCQASLKVKGMVIFYHLYLLLKQSLGIKDDLLHSSFASSGVTNKTNVEIAYSSTDGAGGSHP